MRLFPSKNIGGCIDTIHQSPKTAVMSSRTNQSQKSTLGMNKFFVLALLVIFTFALAEENVLKSKNVLSTVHDADTLGTLHQGEVLSAKQTSAKPNDASSAPPGNYVPTKGTVTEQIDNVGAAVFFAGPLTAQGESQAEKVLEGQVEMNKGEVTQEHEALDAGVTVNKHEDTLESTEDYRQTLAAAVNTARALEVDAPQVLAHATPLEAPTNEDEEMLNVKEEEAVVGDEPEQEEVQETVA